MGTRRDHPHSDPDYTSSSEQSCDTVIYCGPYSRHLSDQELTDNEHPPPCCLSCHKCEPRDFPKHNCALSPLSTDPCRLQQEQEVAMQSEHWLHSVKPVEQWIDGPSAFVVQDTLTVQPPPDSGAMSRLPRSNVLETIQESKLESSTLEKQPIPTSQTAPHPQLPKNAFISDWLDKHGSDVTQSSKLSHSSSNLSSKRLSKATDRLKSRSASNSPCKPISLEKKYPESDVIDSKREQDVVCRARSAASER